MASVYIESNDSPVSAKNTPTMELSICEGNAFVSIGVMENAFNKRNFTAEAQIMIPLDELGGALAYLYGWDRTSPLKDND